MTFMEDRPEMGRSWIETKKVASELPWPEEETGCPTGSGKWGPIRTVIRLPDMSLELWTYGQRRVAGEGSRCCRVQSRTHGYCCCCCCSCRHQQAQITIAADQCTVVIAADITSVEREVKIALHDASRAIRRQTNRFVQRPADQPRWHVHEVSSSQRVNPLKPNSSNYYTLPYRPNLPFLISDIRALWRSVLSARVPECQKLKMAG